ncbi:MAG: rhomboid family intramembrane serine protease [Myxococcota bacterium]|nr:rhomboid family intramembrane serine protease [Myxococcota bacterium]
MSPSSPPPRPIYTGASHAPSDDKLLSRRSLDRVPVSLGLLALNVALFALQLARSSGGSLMHLSSREALAFGASDSLATIGENRWETLVTACFLHDGILHLGFNMLVLWRAGPLVERAVGSARMALMYLVAGAVGNASSNAHSWLTHGAQYTLGASGAISGVVAAAMVVGWRVQGWRGQLTQAMAGLLGILIASGIASNLSGGGRIDNAAHLGGAAAGAAMASLWRRGFAYSPGAAKAVLGVCTGVLVTCILIVVIRDQDPFATMTLQERSSYTNEALADGRCRDARDGQLAVERLRGKLAPVTSLRAQVDSLCGAAGVR